MKYQVIYSRDISLLEERVSEKLNQGWRLQGGVSINGRGADVDFAQALVLAGPDEPKEGK